MFSVREVAGTPWVLFFTPGRTVLVRHATQSDKEKVAEANRALAEYRALPLPRMVRGEA